MAAITWTDTPGGSAAHVDGVLVCQVRKLGIGGWSAAWRNGMTWDVSDQVTQVPKQASRHFARRDQAKSAVESALTTTCAKESACYSESSQTTDESMPHVIDAQPVSAIVGLFPDSEYAHCPFCGAVLGMGLCSARGEVGFVRCQCGAQGPEVLLKTFKDSAGSVDVNGFDDAVRRAWNSRSGSNGLAEIQVRLNDAVSRMIAFNNPAILGEVKHWATLMSEAQLSACASRS